MLCFRSCFRCWDVTVSHLTKLVEERGTAAVCFIDEETDPKVTAKVRYETKPVSCQNPPPPALDTHNYSLLAYRGRTSRVCEWAVKLG